MQTAPLAPVSRPRRNPTPRTPASRKEPSSARTTFRAEAVRPGQDLPLRREAGTSLQRWLDLNA